MVLLRAGFLLRSAQKEAVMKWAILLTTIMAVSVFRPAVADVFNMPEGLTSLEFVTVGNPGNSGELSGEGAGGAGTDRICGAVDYEYNIGKYEVTAGQYCEFLNAVAAADLYNLYNPWMDYETDLFSRGCNIKRHGFPGNYIYTVESDWANRPVNYVHWGDAARFCNWLHNGQPTGAQDLTTTEDGAYYLNGAPSSSDLLTVTREADWKWAIPSEDEWYKAAYHKNDGVTGNYWDFPTGSDLMPSNNLDGSGNNATFYNGGYTVGSPHYRTEVGAHVNSESPYGTFDMGGNIMEWTETVLDDSRHTIRGGSFLGFLDAGGTLHAAIRYGTHPALGYDTGFRVAEVPEPCTICMLALGGIVLGWKRRY